MRRHIVVSALGLVVLTSASGVRRPAAPERIRTHDNDVPAGTRAVELPEGGHLPGPVRAA